MHGGEYSYSSTLSLTLALDEGGGQRDRFTGKVSRYPLYRRLCGPHGKSGRLRNISPYRNLIARPSSQ
jgi:hypothetical protein